MRWVLITETPITLFRFRFVGDFWVKVIGALRPLPSFVALSFLLFRFNLHECSIHSLDCCDLPRREMPTGKALPRFHLRIGDGRWAHPASPGGMKLYKVLPNQQGFVWQIRRLQINRSNPGLGFDLLQTLPYGCLAILTNRLIQPHLMVGIRLKLLD